MVRKVGVAQRFWWDLSSNSRFPFVSHALKGSRATSTTSSSVSTGAPASAAVESAGPILSVVEGRQRGDAADDSYDNNGRHQQQLAETAKRVREVVVRRPRWESFLLSHFAPSELFHPTCVRHVLRPLVSTKPLLSLRYLLWLSSHPDAPPADAATSASLLDALANARAWKAALLAIRSTKCRPDPPAIELFLYRLIQREGGVIDEAMETISIVKTHLGYSPSLPTWNSIFSASLRAGRTDLVWRLYEMMMGGRTDLVWRLYEMMMQLGISGDASTAGYLIEAFCMDNELDDAYRLLREVSRNGLVPDVISITKLVTGYCRDGNYGKVSELLHLMIAIGCMPDIFTYQSIIHGLCDNGKADEGFRIFNNLKLRGYAPDLVTYTTMIDGLCKMGRTTDAWNLWSEMVAKGTKPNEYAYNVIINGYCKAGDLSKAQELYQEMCRSGFRESTVSCNTLIAGLCMHGRVGEAVDMFEEMPTKGIEHDVITYNTLIQGLCKEGRTAEAMKLYETLSLVGLQPSVSTYTPLIEALCNEGNVLGAMELMRCMKEKGLEPLVRTNDYIINGFCRVGKAEAGMAWLVNMLEYNLKPQRDTINRLLECLSNSFRVDDALLVLDAVHKIGYSLETSVCYLLVSQLCGEDHRQAALQMEEILVS
ncbi:hypothetical protein C4D60_Mb10t12910 [Musa balbisiana]|uniref:Pentacotripeptide-repeat region of PRORP domain-containing protein n=1 Tax=Musa balbisiana TaxID=52838 RepID=A0A4S8IY35_MUSBA|nr:hypothetical protein C4D60_Mb10t12910 [Musa balbisiana]